MMTCFRNSRERADCSVSFDQIKCLTDKQCKPKVGNATDKKTHGVSLNFLKLGQVDDLSDEDSEICSVKENRKFKKTL